MNAPMTALLISKPGRTVSIVLGTLAVGTAVAWGLARQPVDLSVFAVGGAILLWDGAYGKVRRRAEGRAAAWVRWAMAIALGSAGCLAAGIGHNPASNLPDRLGLAVWAAYWASLPIVVVTVLIRIGLGVRAHPQAGSQQPGEPHAEE